MFFPSGGSIFEKKQTTIKKGGGKVKGRVFLNKQKCEEEEK